MLEGKLINLRVLEKEDLPFFAEWINKPEFYGEHNPLRQVSRTEIEKTFEKTALELKNFVVEKKDGSKIGFVCHFTLTHPVGKLLEIGYSLIPSERGKGYCTEAVQIMVDYLFLSRDVIRVQACTDTRNVASQRVLEKAGFKKEGLMRKYFFLRGGFRDAYLYSILREEWKDPKIIAGRPDRQG
ncbi:MAG: GNAT family N-acetyltransferase [Candidatus Bathyarchaeota archaeon]|nr:MAG: GNAT family N-acetyltransferase [Candidatus Bathyarchaeota archaeon]